MKIIKINAIWCPACIILNKTMRKIEAEFTEIEFIDYDYDMDSEEVLKYSPGKKLPVLIFLKDGKEVQRLIGERSYEEISEIINNNI